MPSGALLAITIFTNSSRTRSPETAFSEALCFLMASAVFSSIVKPSVVASRAARSIRKASSLKRSSAVPTALMIFFCKSSCPPNKSVMVLSASMAMAFTVKSRRDKSSSNVLACITASGWRLSEYFASDRNVVTSISETGDPAEPASLASWANSSFFAPVRTVTVKNVFS